jgi:hypothetical protein
MLVQDSNHYNSAPRHEWGKQITPDMEAKFKWVIRDGLWAKCYSIRERDDATSHVDQTFFDVAFALLRAIHYQVVRSVVLYR